MCVECEDMPASVNCQACEDVFCAPCYRWLHRRGARAKHPIVTLHSQDASMDALHREEVGTTESFIKMLQETNSRLEAEEALKRKQQAENKRIQQRGASALADDSPSPVVGATSEDAANAAPTSLNDVIGDDAAGEETGVPTTTTTTRVLRPPSDDDDVSDDDNGKNNADETDDDENGSEEDGEKRATKGATTKRPVVSDQRLLDRYKYIPLRLTADERTLLQLVERAMDVSEYTDKVDVSSDYFGYRVGPKDQVIKRELEDVFSILSGLYSSCDFRAGKRFVAGKTFEDNQDFFAQVFEVARRFKITNPDKMRSTYGKMMHLLQDAVTPGMSKVMCKLPIQTVCGLLSNHGDYSMLAENDMAEATVHIESRPGETRESIQERERQKREARGRLLDHYGQTIATPDIERIIDSIADANSFIAQNRHPVDRMLEFLRTHFNPERETSNDTSLQISYGYEGSKLSHSHSTQYTFVYQSLCLWREIQDEMFRLWVCSDRDLLNERSGYHLRNTGQGLNRVQSAPNVSHVMSEILGRVHLQVRSRSGGWVGLSVVHLGDRDVPNALVFIDKYTQVPRILGPIVKVLDSIDSIALSDPLLQTYINTTFGGPERAKTIILRDFFRHGFNGSGSDGGSCIDGRLTSSWNWCSKLDKKPYKHLFMLSGFQGFDGSFK